MSIKRTLAVLCLLFSSIAHAGMQPDGRAYIDIASEYSKLLGKAERAHDPAILNNSQGTALAVALSDDRHFLKAAPYPAAEFKKLMNLCEASRFMLDWTLGFDANVDPAMTQVQQQQARAEAFIRNSHLFSAQLSHLEPFTFRCYARITRTMDSEQGPEFNAAKFQALNGMQGGVRFVLVEAFREIFASDTDDELRVSMARATAETMPDLMLLYSKDMRDDLLKKIDASATDIPAIAPYVKAMRDALHDTPCGRFCQIGEPRVLMSPSSNFVPRK